MFYMARIVGYATLTIGLVASIAFMHNTFLLESSVATIFIGYAVYGIGIYEPEIKEASNVIQSWNQKRMGRMLPWSRPVSSVS